jgi:predicted NodU family carbamoyl transferase
MGKRAGQHSYRWDNQTAGEKFGLGTLVNTSFNPSKHPIVPTPMEALLQFARTDMDALVLNNTLVWRE